VQEWIAVVGANIERFNARLRDGLLDGEIFYTVREAQIVLCEAATAPGASVPMHC
jgi:hypothetical protein